MLAKDEWLMTNAVLDHTGKVTLFRGTITKITCRMRMEFFPFDVVSVLGV
jgi:hypothetical protein